MAEHVKSEPRSPTLSLRDFSEGPTATDNQEPCDTHLQQRAQTNPEVNAETQVPDAVPETEAPSFAHPTRGMNRDEDKVMADVSDGVSNSQHFAPANNRDLGNISPGMIEFPDGPNPPGSLQTVRQPAGNVHHTAGPALDDMSEVLRQSSLNDTNLKQLSKRKLIARIDDLEKFMSKSVQKLENDIAALDEKVDKLQGSTDGFFEVQDKQIKDAQGNKIHELRKLITDQAQALGDEIKSLRQMNNPPANEDQVSQRHVPNIVKQVKAQLETEFSGWKNQIRLRLHKAEKTINSNAFRGQQEGTSSRKSIKDLKTQMEYFNQSLAELKDYHQLLITHPPRTDGNHGSGTQSDN
ncbi:hypothetical protein H9Q72_009347 [Fusarium xylarioides]|uniref:Uncharacterized protein n=1 Tax=Fusarium xylarioides TaxID=221167 RepID=A0A9P7L3M5_9HYPO|nr:hypothetical protein H9Q72_009347 [Fusarium xylarioides]